MSIAAHTSFDPQPGSLAIKAAINRDGRSRVSSPRLRAAVLTLVSLVAWETWEGLRKFPHPWGDLKGGTYTDHFSHMNAARVFPVIGAAIWRQGYDSIFRHLTADEVHRLPPDVAAGGSYSGSILAVPSWPADKPLVSSWSKNPRNYPPGDMLLVAPIAAAYAHTNLSFTTANRLLLMLFILYAHLAILWIFQTALESAASFHPSDRHRKWFTVIVAGIVYLEVIHWTLEGFYDAAALAPLVLCARFLRDRRGLAALVAYCVAAFIHFRTYFFAPLAIYGLVLLIRERQWVQWRSGAIIAVICAATLAVMSLTVFTILWPAFQRLPLHSPFSGSIPLLRAGFLVGVAIVCRTFYRSRAWWDLAVLGWLTVMFMSLHERYPWHTELAILPWLSAPIFPHAPDTTVDVLIGRCAVFVISVCCLFGAEPFAAWHLWSV